MALRKGFQMGGENVVDVGSEVEDNENTEVVRGQNFDDACVCAVL